MLISGCILHAGTCPELQVDTSLDILQAGTCPELQVDTSLDILQAGTCPELQVDTSLDILQAGTCPGLQVDTSLDILQAGTCPELQVDTSLDILQAGTCLELQVDTNLENLLSLIQACSGAVPGCNFVHPGTAPETFSCVIDQSDCKMTTSHTIKLCIHPAQLFLLRVLSLYLCLCCLCIALVLTVNCDSKLTATAQEYTNSSTQWPHTLIIHSSSDYKVEEEQHCTV